MKKVGWIAVGAVVTGTAAVWLLWSAGPDQTEVQQHTEQRIPERLVFVDFRASDIKVVGGDYDEVRIERTLRWDRSKPTVTESWSGNTLRISHNCPEQIGLDNLFECSVDYLIQLPGERRHRGGGRVR